MDEQSLIGAGGNSLGQLHFGQASLGDARRTRRLVKVADRVLAHPQGTLPQKMQNPSDLAALYRLADVPQVTHAAVIQTHCQHTAQRMSQQQGGVVLRLHDTTELDFSANAALAQQLGPVGQGHGRGYLCHNTLAVTPDRRVLGLCAQVLHCRRIAPKGQSRPRSRQDPQRESRLWLAGIEAAGAAPRGCFCVEVADRGADTFEFLDHLHAGGLHYVIRCAHNRRLAGEDHVGDDRIHGLLKDYVRDLPTLGRHAVQVRRQAKTRRKPRRAERQTVVGVAAGPLTIAPPNACRGTHRGVALDVWVVHVREEEPEAGTEPLEWILLTNVPALTLAAACERADWYGCRPMIEELHKGMKSGVGIEGMRFERPDRVAPMIGLLTVVAAVLLQLREAGRAKDAQDRPATELFGVVWVAVLSGWRYGDAKRPMSMQEFMLALGRLGGHQNRKADGPPGWQTLWRGWQNLRLMVLGAEAMAEAKCVEG